MPKHYNCAAPHGFFKNKDKYVGMISC